MGIRGFTTAQSIEGWVWIRGNNGIACVCDLMRTGAAARCSGAAVHRQRGGAVGVESVRAQLRQVDVRWLVARARAQEAADGDDADGRACRAHVHGHAQPARNYSV